MLKIKNSAPIEKATLKKCQRLFDIKNSKKNLVVLALISAVLIATVSVVSNYRVGYTIKVDNVVLGTVATKGEYYEILDEVKTEVSNISEIELTPVAGEKFTMEIVSVGSFTEKEELAENIKAVSEKMVEGYTVAADGNFVVALSSEEDANKVVDTYIENFKSDDESITVGYGAEVLVMQGHVPQDAVRTYDEAMDEILKGKVVIHTVAESETIEAISESYNVAKEDILSENEVEEIAVGMSLKIYTGEPVIPIKTVEYINGNIEIPFEIEEKEDSSVYVGQTRIETKGVPGKKYLHAYITKINGVITEENVIESDVITEPKTQVVLVGTKELPPSAGTGSFIMPTSGRLTSPYGSRWGRAHQGIDVGAPTGTPIYASDNGIVIESEYRSNGYGNIIKIDHQNGFVTYYAHCSQLYANVGDVVAKGDKIAAVGSTGRSTGPHLHFEIRKNDVAQNPYNYIK